MPKAGAPLRHAIYLQLLDFKAYRSAAPGRGIVVWRRQGCLVTWTALILFTLPNSPFAFMLGAMKVQGLVSLLMLLSVSALGCNTQTADNSTATTTPTATAPSQNEVFTGTLAPQGINLHSFNVAAVGTLSITLTAAGPPSTIFIAVGVGTPTTTATGTTCSILATNTVQAGAASAISGTVQVPGPYCLQVSDVGNLTANITYSVLVTHT